MWIESFAYDRNGNRASKTTPWGTIVFRYDAENRLVSKGSIEYRYDALGNLLSETGLRKKALYDYTANGRMKTSIVVDEVKKTRAVTNYRYDAFGRRTLAQDEGGKLMRTLYDGMSFEPIREAVSYADGTLTTTLATRPTRQSGESEGRYAWIDGSGTDRSAFLDGDGYSLISGRFVGTRVNLYANGTGVASSRSPDASAGEASSGTAGVSYLGNDGLGSVSSASDEYGSLEDVFLYDAFGKPYEGDFTAGISLGYTGKTYDPITGLYDYGYRDYSPDTARFTTVDPIRDGTNWFAYVNNDPVNFTDLWGLRPLTPEEIALHKAAGGGPVDYDKIDVVDDMPTPQEVRDAASGVGVDMSSKTDEEIQAQINDAGAMSLPNDKIYVPDDARDTQEKLNALIAHEVEHQSQYQNGDSGEVFKDLVDEAQMTYPDPDPYETPGYKEYEAQQVEEKAKDLYKDGWTPPESGGKNK